MGRKWVLSAGKSALHPFAQAVLCVMQVTLGSWGSPVHRGCPAPQFRMLCLYNPLPCAQQVPEAARHPPCPPSPQLLPPKMEPLSPENGAMWQRSQTLAHNSSNLRAADCCSAINTTRAINKHYLSALVFLMPGHCALACGATQRLKAGFRDESKLV